MYRKTPQPNALNPYTTKEYEMSEIGFLSPSQEGPENVLTGSIRTLQLALDITLRPTGEPANSTRPSHRIMTKTEIGQFVEVGSAWTKEMTRPDKFGETFLSLTIDDPSFAQIGRASCRERV